MGIGKEEMSGHGFRAVARTILDEGLHVRPDYAHNVLDPTDAPTIELSSCLNADRGCSNWWIIDKLKAGEESIVTE
jgi:hypothetical protein